MNRTSAASRRGSAGPCADTVNLPSMTSAPPAPSALAGIGMSAGVSACRSTVIIRPARKRRIPWYCILRSAMPYELWLIRHGETAWSRSGAHTSRTDLPLTETGRKKAADIGRYLAGRPFALVLTSPMLRARDTCRLAGFGDEAVIDPNLCEWDYGDYEGLTTQ